MSQTDILIYITQLQNPFLNGIASILTFLGNEEFYFLILPFVYWCISKQIGFRLFYIFLLSMYVNSFFKISFAVQRPVGANGVQSIFLSSAEAGSHYPYDSFPSGHAQGSATLWGYLAAVIKNRTFTIFAFTLIFFISIARVYTGLHWPSDIIVGASVGLVIVIISLKLQAYFSRLSGPVRWILALFVPFLLLACFQEPEGIKFSGFLLGAGIAYLIESRYVQMRIEREWKRKGLAFLTGTVGMAVLQLGLKSVFPEGLLFDFIRYLLLGLWGLLIAPTVFVLLGIYRRDQKQGATLNL